MKVETPQILWNNQSDSRVPAALYSVSILESGLNAAGSVTTSPGRAATPADATKLGTILATAGSTHEVNLWSLAFPSEIAGAAPKPIFQRKSNTKMNYICSLSRHERTVNVVRFSPNGLHLATAGDSGTIIVWSVPVSKRGGNNGHHFWSTLTKETELTVRIIAGSGDGVCDIAWSADSKRFVVGTVDHCFGVYEDANYDSNHHHHQPANNTAESSPTKTTEKPQVESQWKAVFRSTSDHSNFIQGVAYDPLGVYLSSMSSDRSVKVFARKLPTKSKKKVLRPSNAPKGPLPPTDHQQMVTNLLTESKFQLGKAKTIKYRKCALDETGAQVKHHLFADESTMESFFRRLCWTNDGAYLIAPAGLWHSDPLNVNSKVPPAFATLLFARHRFDQPCKVLYGLEKPAVVVRPHPKLFKLPAQALNESKENHSPNNCKAQASSTLPYRSIFAVLTVDSVLVYDTHHNRPLALIKGLHYSALTDCCWSPDGKSLILCSSDGYVSFVRFGDGELGELYEPPKVSVADTVHNTTMKSTSSSDSLMPREVSPLPPCEPGQKSVLEAPVAKRAKKTRIVPTLLSSLPSISTPAEPTGSILDSKGPLQQQQQQQEELGIPEPSPAKRTAEQQCVNETDRVGLAVTKLSLECNTAQPPKKKKRIQPTLISATNATTA